VLKRDRHRVLRETVDEVGRAVERIDDPGVVGAGAGPGGAGLLGQDRVLRIRGLQRVDDRRLGSVIDFGDEVAATLDGNADEIEVEAGAIDDRAGFAGRLDGRVQHRVHREGFRGGGTARVRAARLLRILKVRCIRLPCRSTFPIASASCSSRRATPAISARPRAR
jgi:hypothetical protein